VINLSIGDLLAALGILVAIGGGLVGAVWYLLNKRIDDLNARVEEAGGTQAACRNASDQKRTDMANRLFGEIGNLRDKDVSTIRDKLADVAETVAAFEGVFVRRAEMESRLRDISIQGSRDGRKSHD